MPDTIHGIPDMGPCEPIIRAVMKGLGRTTLTRAPAACPNWLPLYCICGQDDGNGDALKRDSSREMAAYLTPVTN